jgi:pyruvate/2-oxoglutarate dehydrogenase complex dihydrolipoamide acyltransferase (E2) component
MIHIIFNRGIGDNQIIIYLINMKWLISKNINTITKKAVNNYGRITVIEDKIEIREILNMTILIDHDAIDGSVIARFISDLSSNIEKGLGL